MENESSSKSVESKNNSNEFDRDDTEYLKDVAAIAEEVGYEGLPNRSLYELAMRMTGGRPEIGTIRQIAKLAHERGLLSDQFGSNQLGIFRAIGDNSHDYEIGGEVKEKVLTEPLWKRIVREAEEMPVVYGDPDVLWTDIANLYGFDLETTFNSATAAAEKEARESYDNKISTHERQYSAPVFASYDMFSDEQRAPGEGFGKGVDW